jgi:hypothetical protein
MQPCVELYHTVRAAEQFVLAGTDPLLWQRLSRELDIYKLALLQAAPPAWARKTAIKLATLYHGLQHPHCQLLAQALQLEQYQDFLQLAVRFAADRLDREMDRLRREQRPELLKDTWSTICSVSLDHPH